MKKFFNTTGPCDPKLHYMLPPQARLPGLHALIEQGHYFVTHAARQSGKTTLILDLEHDSGSVRDSLHWLTVLLEERRACAGAAFPHRLPKFV